MNNKIIAYNSIDYVFGTHFWSLDSAGVGSCSKGGWEQDRGVGVNSVFIPSLGHRTDTYFVQHTIKGQETLEERDWWRFLTMPKDVGMPL